MTVVDMAAWRAASATDEAVCKCGGMWFRPVRVRPDGSELEGAMLLRADGTVQNYAGVMRCLDCGDDYKP